MSPSHLPEGPSAPQGAACDRPELRISDLLLALRDEVTAEQATLGMLAERLGERTFGGLLLALSVPTLLPLPLGVAALLALPIALLSVQVALGARTVWLPRWVLDRPVRRQTLVRVVDAMVPVLRRLERLLRPRLHPLSTPPGERLVGVAGFTMALVLAMPVPLLTWLPAIALVLLAAGLTERDGLVIGIGLLLSAATVLVVAALSVGMVAAAGELL